MEKTVLTVSEAAAMLNAHPNSVRRWADMGLLPSFRIGLRGDRRFRVEDIAYLVDSWNALMFRRSSRASIRPR
jgi:excisionase family DNA binding protein